MKNPFKIGDDIFATQMTLRDYFAAHAPIADALIAEGAK